MKTETAKHTPGPWETRDTSDAVEVGHKNESFWRTVAYVYRPISTERQTADARLIASAPELLEAAKLVYRESFTDSYCEFCDRHAPKTASGFLVGQLRHDDECIIERLGAAIAKAEKGA